MKIDQSFVSQITADPEVSSIVSAIIHMGKSLNHVVIAEGIETQEQRAYLQTSGVRKDKDSSSVGPWPPNNLPIYFRWA